MEWLSHSQKKHCELCKTSFRFTKVYEEFAPSTIPLPLFLRQLVVHCIHGLLKLARYILVSIIWLCWLPWSIRQVWRGLFWLADGSWVSEKDLMGFLVDPDQSRNSTNLLDAGSALTPNLTIQGTVIQALTPLSSLLGLSSDEILLNKVIRLMLPRLFGLSSTTVSNNTAAENPLVTPSQRRPSLLSNMTVVNSATGYPVFDNAILDILEGQLVCLLIITAFILVFLIREWVINQQPVLNVPEPPRVDNGDGNPAPQEEEAQQVRRRRRVLHDVADEDGNVVPAEHEPRILLRPRGVGGPRRAATEDNLSTQRYGSARRDLPVGRSTSFQTQAQTVQTPNSDRWSVQSLNSAESSSSPDVRPPPPLRRALDDPVNIQRIIQESSSRPTLSESKAHIDVSESTPETILSNIPNIGESTGSPRGDGDLLGLQLHLEAPPTSLEHDDLLPLLNLSDVSTQPAEGTSRITPVETYRKLHIEDQEIGPEPYAFDAANISTTSEEEVSPNMSDSMSRSPRVLTPISSPSATTSEISDGVGELADQGGDDDILDRQEVTFLEPLLRWLWEFDGNDTQEARQENVLDPLATGDYNMEDPFAHPPPPPALNLQPGLQPAGPDIQFDWNANDLEAIEDAEDLDGILELLGIRGPIVGMVQNVIFSEFLITLTIAASVWLPYIWGKIALLILANPVGVFIRAPIYVVTRAADTSVDLILFCVGLLAHGSHFTMSWLGRIVRPLAPGLTSFSSPPFLRHLSSELTKSSGSRLEETFSRTISGLRPDFPTFSMQSRYVLRVFRVWGTQILTAWSQFNILDPRQNGRFNMHNLKWIRPSLLAFFKCMFSPHALQIELSRLGNGLQTLFTDLKLQSSSTPEAIDLSLLRWEARDRVIAVILGYLFFAAAGSFYLKIARLINGLSSDEKVNGVFADSLRQAGGVMKVIVIIGIEMIAFPLYCGILLDVALLPLFADANLSSRIDFMVQAPITGLFVHWFIGTCYMFHFALFVSMCRKIFRKGVLYFIRDPDDPTFHPVRDVLERPVLTQLGKIAYSALIYGGLVIMCLGGVVWAVSCIEGVLPIHWTTTEPRLAFPLDAIFYNFMLPFIVRKAEPSRRISTIYEWWFRGCASALRLTHFLFGEEREEEKISRWRRISFSLSLTKSTEAEPIEGSSKAPCLKTDDDFQADHRDGTWVFAPANDSVRIPKGERVFLEVNEDSEHGDDEKGHIKRTHDRTDDRFTKVYVPPNFRARVLVFIVLLWCFTATTGVVITVGPMILGRMMIHWVAGNNLPPNDLYALTAGVLFCCAIAYVTGQRKFLKDWICTKAKDQQASFWQALSSVYSSIMYLLGLAYLSIMFGIMIPLALSLLAEVYVHLPAYNLLSERDRNNASVGTDGNSSEVPYQPPSIFILQTWVLGFLYLRLTLRLMLRYPNRHTRAARATGAILRHGLWRPDVRLATRSVVLPIMVSCITLILTPLLFAQAVILALGVRDAQSQTEIYRAAYPCLLTVGVTVYLAIRLKQQIATWRVRIRDEVYLVGERLHNFQEVKRSSERSSDRKDKGKRRADAQVTGGTSIEVNG